MPTGEKLTFRGHIAELRQRLIYSVIALGITTVIAFIFTDKIMRFLIRPAGDIPLIYIDMTEMIGTYMKVALASGVILALPFLLYQVVMFISPALTAKEKRYLLYVLPGMTLMFLIGVAFAYKVLLPPSMKFLLTFGSDIAEPQIKIGNYMSLVTRMLLAIGAVFESPVIIMFLARIGVVNSKWLGQKRKYAYMGAFIVSAIITPTMDPVNQSLVAGPLIVLYEVSIWLAWLVQKRKPKPVAAEPPAGSELSG